MISKKGKKRLVYGGRVFYWFVRADGTGRPRLHVLSEDKKVRLEQMLMDREEPAVSESAIRLLEQSLENDKKILLTF